jgi:hypothetical protein
MLKRSFEKFQSQNLSKEVFKIKIYFEEMKLSAEERGFKKTLE